MKTYPVLKLLTDEEIERILTTEFFLSGHPRTKGILQGHCKSGRITCLLGVALEDHVNWDAPMGIYQGSPTEALLAPILKTRTSVDPNTVYVWLCELTSDNDSGLITPDNLPKIVAASRGA